MVVSFKSLEHVMASLVKIYNSDTSELPEETPELSGGKRRKSKKRHNKHTHKNRNKKLRRTSKKRKTNKKR